MTADTVSSRSFVAEVFSALQDGIFIIDRNYVISETNPAFEKYVPEFLPACGKKCYHVSYEDHICEACPAQTMFETGESTSSIHYKELKKTKEGFWIEHFAHPIKSPSGEIIGAICTIRDITREKEKESALQRFYEISSELKSLSIQSIITEGSVPIIFLDVSGIIQFVNPAFLQLTGYKNKDLIGVHFVEKLLDERTISNSFFQHKYTAFYACDTDQYRQEIQLRCRDGELRWIDFSAFAVNNNEGNRAQITCVLLDITERFQMVQAVESANELVRLMLDSTPLGCTLVDRNGHIIDCNQAALNLFNIPSKQHFPRRIHELAPEYQPDGTRSAEKIQEYINILREQEIIRFEWMHQTIDGTPIPAEVVLTQIKKDNSYFIAGYSQDLRRIKEYESVKEMDNRRINALLELAQMTQQTEQEIIDFAIKTVTMLTKSTMGYAVILEHAKDSGDALAFRSLILDKTFSCVLPMTTPSSIPHTYSGCLTECLRTGQAVIHSDVMAMPGPRTFPEGHIPVHSHMNFPLMNGENAVGILGVGNKETPYNDVDVKQLTLLAQGVENLLSRKKYSDDLEKSRDEAEKANKAKSSFLAHMSHEIRTPLNGVIGLSDLLAATQLDDQQKEYVQLINSSGNTLLFLINDILDFSKIEANKLDIISEPFDLSVTISTVLDTLVSRISGKNLELGVSFCPDLPRILYGDSGRIRQVLINLVGNAVKFTDKGGVRIDVTIDSVIDTTLTLRFCIIDTGIGIAPEAINRIFKAFSQADTSSARIYGGTGLGLAISMQLVRLMNGDIGVTSQEGKGSTFWFTLPFQCTPKLLECLTKKECFNRKCPNINGYTCLTFINREVGTPYRPAGRSVLIVDDNAVQSEALHIQLRNWDMQCTLCSSIKDAMHLTNARLKNESRFDLCVIDSTLDDGTGLDLVLKLYELSKTHEEAKTMQFILLRSISEEHNLNILDETRIEIITKPVLNSALFNAVTNRIFAAEKQISVGSGASSSEEFDSKHMRPKTTPLSRPIQQLANPAANMKSYLAGKIHLLVVEDNRINQIVAKNILLAAGFSCDIVDNGNTACSVVRTNQYDVILMDCQMPEMDGFEATDLIRNWEREHNQRHLPIIALTANAVKEDIQKCFDAGMDAYCSKPINPSALIQMIESWYEKSHQNTTEQST